MAFLLGVWCGFGLYLDSMFVVTLAGLVPTALMVGAFSRAGWERLVIVIAFMTGLLIGASPREVGRRVDSHNPYDEQFGLMTRPDVLLDHFSILFRECLPRLASGRTLPGLASDPDPSSLGQPSGGRRTVEPGATAAAATGFAFVLWFGAAASLLAGVFGGHDRASRAVAGGLALSAAFTLAAFVVNRNIFNSDNYRYLVTLLVPASVGFGWAGDRLSRRGSGGRMLAWGFALAFGLVMSADLVRWYQGFGWIDGRGMPVRKAVEDPALAWLTGHPEVGWIEGGYWDVYRLSFLTGGRVRGKPYPVYPDRFPTWTAAKGSRAALLARTSPEGNYFREVAERNGGRVSARMRGLTAVVLP